MMRQYDLIERVKRYNPATSEPLLNRAYVYAMRAHGEQKRASEQHRDNGTKALHNQHPATRR
jgi:(p)ppGpp synthase/HD superfamily hydrolase